MKNEKDFLKRRRSRSHVLSIDIKKAGENLAKIKGKP